MTKQFCHRAVLLGMVLISAVSAGQGRVAFSQDMPSRPDGAQQAPQAWPDGSVKNIVALKLRPILPFTDWGIGHELGWTAFLGGSVTIEVIQLITLEGGGWVPFVVEGKYYQAFVAAGAMPVFYDTRKWEHSGWFLQAGGLLGYRLFHSENTGHESIYGKARQHCLSVDGAFDATYGTQNIGFNLRLLLGVAFPLTSETSGDHPDVTLDGPAFHIGLAFGLFLGL